MYTKNSEISDNKANFWELGQGHDVEYFRYHDEFPWVIMQDSQKESTIFKRADPERQDVMSSLLDLKFFFEEPVLNRIAAYIESKDVHK